MKRHCRECGAEIKGRSDKKFCGDSCRNGFNNRAHRKINNLIRKTNRRLVKNLRILEELNPQGKTRISRDVLIGKGFDFNYFTSIYETRQGNRYFFCYDQGYLYLNEHHLALVKKLDHINQSGKVL